MTITLVIENVHNNYKLVNTVTLYKLWCEMYITYIFLSIKSTTIISNVFLLIRITSDVVYNVIYICM